MDKVGTSGDDQDRSLSALIRLGFGATDPRTTLYLPLNVFIASALIANIPQIGLSIIYLFYNALLTTMMFGYEWATYSYHRKGLRISGVRQGEQRSTYFLSLPYRFAIPLMFLSGILHWLTSQSLFSIALEVSRPLME